MLNTKRLFQEFKQDLEISKGISLDLRKHQFINNQYGNSPIFSYADAEKIISFLYEWCGAYIEVHSNHYPDFAGWTYNQNLSIDELRTTKLKDVVFSKIDDLVLHYN